MRHAVKVGARSGHLVVRKFFGTVLGRRQWECECDCGGEIVLSTMALVAKNVRSCGCKGDSNGPK